MAFGDSYGNLIKEAPVKDRWPLIGGLISFLRSPSWVTWFANLVPALRQLYVIGSIDFPNTAANTSSAELTLAFTLVGPNGVINVPVDSFIVCMRIVSTSTGLPVDQPANSFFTYRFSADNTIAVRFNNYSAGAIDPGSVKFEFLVQLRATNA